MCTNRKPLEFQIIGVLLSMVVSDFRKSDFRVVHDHAELVKCCLEGYSLRHGFRHCMVFMLGI